MRTETTADMIQTCSATDGRTMLAILERLSDEVLDLKARVSDLEAKLKRSERAAKIRACLDDEQ